MVDCIPRQYVLSCNAILSAKDIFMKIDANKIQLIKYICTVYLEIHIPTSHWLGLLKETISL